MYKKLLFIAAFVSLLSSCVSQKELTYMQNNEDSTIEADSTGVYKLSRSNYRIQVNDILNISISSYDEKASNIFNTNSDRGSFQVNDAVIYTRGSSVDDEGNIRLPVIGIVHVEGLVIDEVRKAITTELHKYFKKDAVYLKVILAGVRFSIIGEVNRPGKYVIYQNQVNIFEAIASAGDITFVGDRHKVQLIRQLPEGVKVIDLDLTNIDVVGSDYYFVQPNDIINIRPLRAKSWGIGTEGWTSMLAVLSLISSTFLIIANVNSLSR
ncbi:MAG: polysaccharide biosynthesis/export family protein [Ichthyobacteriaceae bacterium]|nr:polysaccharide biosynthesis/export family protein [Ichthyobacteriaceae bacterium]